MSPTSTLEWTPDGWQYVLPGIPPMDLKAQAALIAEQPWQPKKPQEPCCFGLFDLADRRQQGLF